MKQEKQSYCLNCGYECHEGKILYRTERRYASEGSEEYEIESATKMKGAILL